MAAVLLDTSAIYAVLDADDDCHSAAVAGWDRLLDGVDTGGVEPLTHSGIVVETAALVQHRLGMPGAEALHRDLLPLVRVVWVDEVLHERAVAALLPRPGAR